MKLRVVHVLTHDSIGLGEDGPTHQSIEHLPSLRLIPQLDVWRPCDPLETAVAWECALERRDGPSALCLSRQNLPHSGGAAGRAEFIRRGGYVLSDMEEPQALIVATGSEVSIALAAQAELALEGIATRVVSLPCTSRFDRQPQAWQDGGRHAAGGGGGSGIPTWRKYVDAAARWSVSRASASRRPPGISTPTSA